MEFVHYNTAKLAKEKGYNGTSGVYYDTTGSLYTQTYSEGIGYIPNFSCYAPLQEELSEWLRDDKGIHISIIAVYKDQIRYYAYIIYTPNSVINSDTKLGVYIIALATFTVCLSILMIVSTAYYCDECELKTAKRWWKYTGIAGIISMVFTILVPSRSTCYQIFGVTIATEVIKNSEALQELPEKSFEAVNRFLDSIASEDKKD